MRLYEFEGKQLFSLIGLSVPNALVFTQNDADVSIKKLSFPVYVKVQVLHGNRAQNGGVVRLEQGEEKAYKKTIQDWLSVGWNGEKVEYVLVEESVKNIVNEHYIAIRWDTATRGPILLYSQHGGSGIESRQSRKKELASYPIDPLNSDVSLQAIAKKITPNLRDTLAKLWQVFYDNDATLVEINPLFELSDGSFVVGDAKVELDDIASFRHNTWENYPKRSAFSRPPTRMEEEAKKINEMDHRGVAGASFFEFDGDIGIMASGGGASLLVMDALMGSGLKPANYTEYSGNPSREKVAALTRLVLSKPGLRGLLVIGGNANFTDIFVTLSGVMDGIEKHKPHIKYPIVVRRGGPRWEEAFAMVRERAEKHKLDITLFGPETSMLEAVPVLVKKVEAHGDSR